MSERIGIAQFAIGHKPQVLKAYGLGSCLAVALYDPEAELGGLGHMLLPKHARYGGVGAVGKFVDAGICQMVDALEQAGAQRHQLVAKIAGGANMFESAHQTLIDSIGARNARSARETLDSLGVTLASEDVGGNRGRTVAFDLASGMLMIYCARDNSEISI
ncbi:MAG: chemotaxis protein CheD [Desulfuromonadales bacterium]|nr:chemotaxis protein CheD [Desulfuromonadales bacterium]